MDAAVYKKDGGGRRFGYLGESIDGIVDLQVQLRLLQDQQGFWPRYLGRIIKRPNICKVPAKPGQRCSKKTATSTRQPQAKPKEYHGARGHHVTHSPRNETSR